jgi:hypothetical protein
LIFQGLYFAFWVRLVRPLKLFLSWDFFSVGPWKHWAQILSRLWSFQPKGFWSSSILSLSIFLPTIKRFYCWLHWLAGKVLLPGILCDLSISRWHLDLVVRFGRLVSARIGTFQKSFNLISWFEG